MRVSIGSYGNYSSGNYSGHCTRLTLGDLTLYFSYKTVVGFDDGFQGTFVRENEWGPTTGKHLNWLDGGDKKNRLPGEEFMKKLSEALERRGLTV
jgi:hypothetical protein